MKILIVEDSVDVRTMMRMLLELDGHTVIERGDGLSGLQSLSDDRPDIGLIDIGLPGMNGYVLAKTANELPSRKNFRLVALTGYGRPEDRRHALDCGFDDHLVKPLQFQELQLILAACSQRQGTASG